VAANEAVYWNYLLELPNLRKWITAIALSSSRSSAEQKNWYSPTAKAYNIARPRYPQDLIRQVVAIAQLSSRSKILEVGCDPATATVSFAASSFHWIPADIGYPKAAKALQNNGRLILLWNKELQPHYEVYKRVSKADREHVPSLDRQFASLCDHSITILKRITPLTDFDAAIATSQSA
jgi:hypothetical protein